MNEDEIETDDSEGPTEGFYAVALPCWKFSAWDIAGIAITGVAGVFGVTSQALNLLSRECAAMANWTRQEHDTKVARAEWEEQQERDAQALRELVEGPVDES